MARQNFKLNVNGVDHVVKVEKTKPLLWVLRENLQLTGTKFGCGKQFCGACTVMVNGRTQRSCGMQMSNVPVNAKITTIEGVDPAGNHPVQVAWRQQQVPQCGYCQSGQILTAIELLNNNPKPSDEDIKQSMNNICRCATYIDIKAAVKSAALNMSTKG